MKPLKPKRVQPSISIKRTLVFNKIKLKPRYIIRTAVTYLQGSPKPGDLAMAMGRTFAVLGYVGKDGNFVQTHSLGSPKDAEQKTATFKKLLLKKRRRNFKGHLVKVNISY